METITAKNFEDARKKIKQSKGKIVFFSEDDELNRKILEKEKIEILLITQLGRRDFMKQRNSGFNQVLAKEAKKKNVIIGIDIDEIINSDKSEKEKILGRVQQNIALCNKNRLQMKFFSPSGKIKNIYDLKALGLVLGMPTWMTKSL